MKKDNKGFSLVELIIVIAIMAILVGIVGSQVLPYLNKSREAKDQQILSGWVTAALSAYSANAAECIGTTYDIKVPVGTNGKPGTAVFESTSSSEGQTALMNSFNELSGYTNQAFSSTTYKAITSVTLHITPNSSPVVQVSAFGNTRSKTSISTTELVAK